MTARNSTPAAAAAAGPRLVLVCQGCRYAWEPTDAAWSPEQLRALAGGCPECGDWLYLGELADPIPAPRRAHP